MKKILTLLAGALTMLSVSCKKDDTGGGPTATPVHLTVKIKYSDSTIALPQQGVTVKIVNMSNGQSNVITSGTEGLATFPSITPGNYTITATITIPAATYTALSQVYVEDDITFNGNLTSTNISNDSTSLQVELTSGRIGNWVFKQIYYAGSNASRGASFRDQFLEIYNNSNEVLYADSLYFGQVHGVNNTTDNSAKPGYQSNSQYDWAQAYGMTDITNANTGYVYMKTMFMIPGSGKDHPVQPGESIIIAQTGLNHAAPYTTTTGVVQSITDPSLTIDLSQADFECYLVEYDRQRTLASGGTFTPYRFDIDNPGVTNLTVTFSLVNNDLVLDTRGLDAFVLLQPTGENPALWPAYQLPTEQAEGTVYTRCPQIPLAKVIDAVELQHVVSTSRVPKRLQNSLDAGPVNVTTGAYTSESIVRKTARTVGTRKVLQDTNNSAIDFVTRTKADPSKTVASFAN